MRLGEWPPAADANGGSERELRAECAFEPPGARECLEEKAAASEVDLKDAEKRVINALTRWDEDTKYVNQAKARFNASNRTSLSIGTPSALLLQLWAEEQLETR